MAHAAAVPQDQAEPTVRALLASADLFLNPIDGERTPDDLPIRWAISFAIEPTMAKLQPEIRAALLGEAIEGPSIVFASYMVGSVSSEHGRVGKKEAKPEGERSLPFAAVVDLENRLAARIARAAEDGELQSTDEAASMLYIWAHISGDEPVRNWIARSFDRPDFAPWLMRTFTSKGFGQSFGDMVSRRFYSVNRESLETLLDVERLELAARDMMSRGEDPNEVAAHFLEGLNEPF